MMCGIPAVAMDRHRLVQSLDLDLPFTWETSAGRSTA